MSRFRRTLVALTTAALPFALIVSGPAVHAADPVGFASSVVVDPQRLGGEPTMEVDSAGNIYLSSIIGFSNSTSLLWKSEDGGESFDLLRIDIPGINRPTKTMGGGDSALIVSPPAPGFTEDTLMFIDLQATSFASGVTFDGGHSFANDNVNASGTIPYADRQWGGWWKDPAGVIHLYNFFNDGILGFAIIETTDYGKTWIDWKREVTADNTRSRPGPMFVDRATGDLYMTWTADKTGFGGAGFTRCTQAKVCTDKIVAWQAGANTNNTFATGAMDRQGNLYVAWSAIPADATRNPTRVYMATSKDKGSHWSAPVVVSKDYPVASMPAIIAGDAGRVNVVYYASPKQEDPNANSGPWWPVMSQSLNALSPSPSWTSTKIAEHPTHINPICTGGLGCAIDTDPTDDIDRTHDRNLADFFTVRLGSDGQAFVTWNDTAGQIGPDAPAGAPIAMFSRQTHGPSLFANVGTLTPPAGDVLPYSGRSARSTLGIPRNWTVDAQADAWVPNHSLTGRGRTMDTLDVLETWIEPALAPDTMKVTMTINDLTPYSVVSINEHNFYMVWWFSGNRVHYAAADVDATMATQCFAGSPSYQTNASTRWALYPLLSVTPPDVSLVPCAWDMQKKQIVMDVPYDAVDAKAGDTLFSVYGSTSHYTPPATAANGIGNVMIQVDATAPFTYIVGQPRTQVEVAGRRVARDPKPTPKPATDRLPSTGGEPIALGLALGAAAIAASLRMRKTAS